MIYPLIVSWTDFVFSSLTIQQIFYHFPRLTTHHSLLNPRHSHLKTDRQRPTLHSSCLITHHSPLDHLTSHRIMFESTDTEYADLPQDGASSSVTGNVRRRPFAPQPPEHLIYERGARSPPRNNTGFDGTTATPPIRPSVEGSTLLGLTTTTPMRYSDQVGATFIARSIHASRRFTTPRLIKDDDYGPWESEVIDASHHRKGDRTDGWRASVHLPPSCGAVFAEDEIDYLSPP